MRRKKETRTPDSQVMYVDCRGRPGQSGSPVIAYRSGGGIPFADGSTSFGGSATYPLGIYSGRINDQSDIGMVWKMSAVREIVQAAA